MARSKPTPKLDVIGSLALDPVTAVSTFTESKLQNQLFVKPPNWDSPEGGIEALAIENDREHRGMLQLQEEMLERAKNQKIINSNRIEELFKMQTVLRERFIAATHFFKQCDDKKRSAESKVSEEKEFHIELKQVIQKYKAEVEELSQFRDVLKNTVKKFEPYEEVINQVVAENDIWASVKDCTDRCDALMITQEEIGELRKIKLQEIEELRLKMVKMSNDAASTVLGLNNELAELERAYAQAQSDCSNWEKMIVCAKECLMDNNLMKNRMLDEIQILYRILCRRNGSTPTLRRIDVEQQLDFIKDEIEILKAVVKECTKK